ncbi:MAG: Flp pilus assembly complex ATPase component TadA [Candidatus Levybacteria bacterium]|nr:Flp pilus assembly complex ATPase component TadA [Candidatus Levybacteria bacterium]
MPDQQQPVVSSTPQQSTVAAVPQPAVSPVQQASSPSPSSPTFLDQEDLSLLDALIVDGAIRSEQAADIKMKSAVSGKSVESVLSELKILPESKIVEAKARILGVPYVSLATTSFSPQAISVLPRAVVERFALIPFFYDEQGQTLSIAMANPVNLDAIEFVRQKTGLSVKAFAASPTEVQNAIDQQYRQELVGEVGAAIKESEEYTDRKKAVDSREIAQLIKEAPIAKIVSTILEFAVTSRSSDIHIEPQEDRVRVRYRIDGILYDKLSLPKNVQEALVSRIKILSGLKIDEHRSPQDGRFNFKVNTEEVDLRISILPTVNGEKIVMRLLRKSGGIPTLAELGLTGLALKHLEDAILKPHGIILVTGPTGSGKTTTLYAVLSKLNTPKVNIMSLEDPVEYQIAGVNQVQINPAVGLTFASGLRAFLRQDPNIILVGEIRDKETTDLALQAALTGHLVFSTLHTQTASGALPRLIDLGAESFLLASTITAIVGQRILRKICPTCKESYAPAPQVLQTVKQVLGRLYTYNDADVRFYRGKGCNDCGGSGYKGRVGIYEVLPVTEKIGQLILAHPDSASIEKEAIAEGMTTMMQDGYLKVLKGVSSVEEVLRVAKE